MSSKPLIWIGIFIGSTIGSLIPFLWGESVFSLSSLFISAVGAIIGIWLAFKINNW